MSRAHNVLAREKWASAELGEIARQELAAHAGRVHLDGPEVRLRAEAAQPLALVLHELATNAAKHGALSAPGGRIRVTWSHGPEGIVLEWCERGGPPIPGAPTREGFGSLLIEANIRAQLAGAIARHWAPEGLTCRLSFGAEALAGRGAAAPGAPLAGRRILLAQDDLAAGLTLAAGLREAGAEVLGPAATIPEAQDLVAEAGRLDAAVLPGTLAGQSVQPLALLLERRAAAVLYTSAIGLTPGGTAPSVLPAPLTARGLVGALVETFARRSGAAAAD